MTLKWVKLTAKGGGVMVKFVELYNREWRIERLGFLSPMLLCSPALKRDAT